MSTLLFYDDRVSRVVPGTSKHEHTFGGPMPKFTAVPKVDRSIRVHRLFDLNMQDKSVPVPRLWEHRLPLCYCFDDRVSAFAYRFSASGKMTAYFQFHDGVNAPLSSDSLDPLPAQFPERSVKVQKVPYDRSSPRDAVNFASVFGLGGLRLSDYLRLLDECNNAYRGIMSETPECVDDLLAFMPGPFAQGAPQSSCLNPECVGRQMGVRSRPLCIVPGEPIPGVQLFGKWGQGVQIVYEVCPACGTLHTSNQCD